MINNLVSPNQPEEKILGALTESPSPNALAPIDKTFGTSGFATLTPPSETTSGECTNLTSSLASAKHYYACSYDLATPGAGVISRIDAEGHLDTSFRGTGYRDFSKHLEEDLFFPRQIIEDSRGNVLCLGYLDKAYVIRIWRFNKSGDLDTRFAGKGYIDANSILDKPLVFDRVIATQRGYLIAGRLDKMVEPDKQFDVLLIGLTPDGILDPTFGQNGVVDVQALLNYESAGSARALTAFIDNAGIEHILVSSIVRMHQTLYSSAVCCFTSRGTLETNFGTQGIYWSPALSHFRDVTVNTASERITIASYKLTLPDTMTPELIRLELNGQPAPEFNRGDPLLFPDHPGSWNQAVEYDNHIICTGSFSYFGLIARYMTDGSLDTAFVPPLGYGEYSNLSRPGLQGNSPMLLHHTKKRLLISGRDDSSGSLIPTIAAFAL